MKPNHHLKTEMLQQMMICKQVANQDMKTLFGEIELTNSGL